MIKFNLQHFAVMDDLMLGNLGEQKKKKKTVPRLPTTSVVQPPKVETPTLPETRVVNGQTLVKNERGAWEVQGGASAPTDIRTNPNYRSTEQREQARVETPTTTSSLDIKSGLEAEKQSKGLQAMKDAFKNAFASTQASIQGQREALVPQFRTERSRIGVEDTMARTGAEKIQATQGLSGAGARSQSDIAQNVITAGALGQSRTRQSEREGQLDALEAEAARQRDFGIAQAEAGVEQAVIQGQIDAETARVANELKQAEIADQRAYDLYLDELNRANEREILVLKNELERENTLLDAEIADARAANDNARAIQLENIRSQNDIKLQGIRDSNAMARVQQGTIGNLAEIEARRQSELDQIAARGTESDDTTPQFSNSAVNSALTNAINASKQRFEQANTNIRRNDPFATTAEFTRTDEIRAVEQFLVDNADNLSPAQGQEIMFRYDLDPNVIARLLGGN